MRKILLSCTDLSTIDKWGKSMDAFIACICVGICIAMHEFGHYWMARKCGLVPETFTVGLGPIVYCKRFAGTMFVFRPLLFGGYVSLPNLDSLTSWKKIKVYLGGPIVNAIMGALLGFVVGPYLPFALLQNKPWWLASLMGAGLSAVFFVASVPVSLYGIVKSLATLNFTGVSGPISILKGSATSDIAKIQGPDTPCWLQFCMTLWFLSLAVGSFNLIPLSFLDGGRIFQELSKNYPKLQQRWGYSSSVFLAVFLVIILVKELIDLFH